ncbi:hypothetical protein ES703_42602 [subsurface metagenome]
MTKFWDLVERSIIVQSVLPLVFGGAVVYLSIVGRPVPELLAHLTWACVSFWMGTKVQHAVDENRNVKGRGATPP